MNAPNASEPLIYVNGEIFPETQARVSVMDRSFLYGDGLFETIRVAKGHCFLWDAHMQRLDLGARYFCFPERLSALKIENAAKTVLAANKIRDGFLRIHLSRGAGPRGYAIAQVSSPNLVISAHSSHASTPARLKMMTAKIRVMADEPWTQFKTANRLPNILARREADESQMDEAMILNHRWTIAEAIAANVFCVRGNAIITPPLAAGALAGTTRAFVMRSASKFGIESREEEMTLEDFYRSDAAFLCSSGLLVTPIESLDAKPMSTENQIIATLRDHCLQALKTE